MSAVTRAQYSRDLQEGLYAHFGLSYDTYEPEWPEVFEQRKSKKAYEEMVLRIGLGEAQYKAEGAPVTFDQGAEGWVSRATFDTYSLAVAFTEEALDDNLYVDLAEQYGREMGKAIQHTKEIKGAAILNNGFNSSYPGGDAVELFSDSHPLYVGGTSSNEPATASDLSEAALEDACIQLSRMTNDRGRPIVIKPEKLVIPPQLMFTAQRILRSSLRVGTANNDINAIKDMNYIPGGYCVNHYLTDPDAWFIKTSEKELGLIYWQRKGVRKASEDDFPTGNIMIKITERFGFSWGDWRCMWGSPGA